MLNGTVEHVVKQSILYSYVLSQPFSVYVDAYPVLQNKQLLEAEQLEYGQHGESVRVLQHKLNKLSYYDDEIHGDFTVLTEHALKKFQADNNITISGQADMITLTTLINKEKKKYMEQIDEMSESIYPGMKSEDVKIAQYALQYFGYYEGDLDGIYGPLTKKALEIAEEEHGLKLIGESDQVTESSLTALYEKDENEEQKIEQKVKKESKEETQKTKKVKVTSTNYSSAIDAAHAQIGTPYVWGGESTRGFDCSGFIQYIFKTENIVLPRTVSDVWNFTQHIDSPSVGDLVFFETYKPGPSHMGIYIGDGKFIHAGESRGVEISELSTSYWDQRYLGARRVN
ncbi:Putative peptidoglycan binding domain-containing protein [Virgibacillus subterraneus]|uniref:Peptidoglycan binding domain-containing protein n=2 Tax=Virgibacillus TaxID=84406 RepID=A0A1H9EPS1_9BACI|nr:MULTISPECIES: NlpC/P60 family protein [Virgibacillus]SDQ55711.1 Putative peptidoglycan binding domain-containing protein [Virgibacillus salinus]SEQ27625.1 Putative peptidoglycan binding domain-containing protein [Virgibacillus subterraneus]